jgi:solute carrier family 25 folate transporter 32
MYETLKSYFAKKQDKSIEELPYTKIFASSIISKSTASLCTYPHEVIRNSIQNLRNHSERTGIMRIVIRNIIKNKGYKGFYTGFFLNLFRILPNNSVMFLSYEYLTRIFTN